HYYGDGRTYHDVIVQLSNDTNFASGVTTVFNNDTNNSAGQGTGTNAEYAETSAGKDITFAAVTARYVRLWTNGNTVNADNHHVEVQVFGTGTFPTPIPTPTFSPGAGIYSSLQSVTISTTISGATICYTTDGTTPAATTPGTCSTGSTYSSPVAVSTSETLKAIASKSGYTNSAVGSAAYTITSKTYYVDN